jgi:hypothetical protein
VLLIVGSESLLLMKELSQVREELKSAKITRDTLMTSGTSWALNDLFQAVVNKALLLSIDAND